MALFKSGALAVIVVLGVAVVASIAGTLPGTTLCSEFNGAETLSDRHLSKHSQTGHIISPIAIDDTASLRGDVVPFLPNAIFPPECCTFGPGTETVATYFCRSPGC